MTAAWSPEIEERYRKNLTSILQAVRRTTQERVAERLGMSAGNLSKLKSEGEWDNAAKFLAASGLKAVPHDFECHDPRYITSLQYLSHRHLSEELQGDEADTADTLEMA